MSEPFDDATCWCPSCEANQPMTTKKMGPPKMPPTVVCAECETPITDVTFPRREQRVRDPSTGWEGTIEEFAQEAAAKIREAAEQERQDQIDTWRDFEETGGFGRDAIR